jgi:NTE family protein
MRPRALAQPKLGVVLPGGGALGAYEAGVVDYVLDAVAADLGGRVPIDVLCGTSVGAFTACMLAAFADQPRVGAARLIQHWTRLRVEQFLRPEAVSILRLLCPAAGRRRAHPSGGGVFDAATIRRTLRAEIPFHRIAGHLRDRRLSAVSVSTTHVASGRTVVFVQSGQALPAFGDRTIEARAATLRSAHLLASAAIPFLFPAVSIDGQLHCEGGLRQNVPLAPALHLGAERLLVVSPHHVAAADPTLARARESAVGGPLFLLGRMLNALLLDRIDSDLERLAQINEVLVAGTASFGADFAATLNRQRPAEAVPLRLVESVVVRPSRSLGAMAGELVRSPRFRARGVIPRLLRQVADLEGTVEADLLSYLLFDGTFAGELIALGREDARARHADLCALFAGRPAQSVRAAASRTHNVRG